MAPFLVGVWAAGVCMILGFAAGRNRDDDPDGAFWLAILWPIVLGLLVVASPFMAAVWVGYSFGKRGRPE